jgi:hypothetical protein
LINVGGWLLLTVIFGSLIFLFQRVEPTRRFVTLLFVLAGCALIWAYGIYRMSNECSNALRGICFVVQGVTANVAWRTTIIAAITALVLNFLFWFVIGRYNPPRSSDEIKVLGMND